MKRLVLVSLIMFVLTSIMFLIFISSEYSKYYGKQLLIEYSNSLNGLNVNLSGLSYENIGDFKNSLNNVISSGVIDGYHIVWSNEEFIYGDLPDGMFRYIGSDGYVGIYGDKVYVFKIIDSNKYKYFYNSYIYKTYPIHTSSVFGVDCSVGDLYSFKLSYRYVLKGYGYLVVMFLTFNLLAWVFVISVMFYNYSVFMLSLSSAVKNTKKFIQDMSVSNEDDWGSLLDKKLPYKERYLNEAFRGLRVSILKRGLDMFKDGKNKAKEITDIKTKMYENAVSHVYKTCYPDLDLVYNGIRFKSFIRTTDFAAGDLVVAVQVGDKIVFSLLDVTGHGNESMMVSRTLGDLIKFYFIEEDYVDLNSFVGFVVRRGYRLGVGFNAEGSMAELDTKTGELKIIFLGDTLAVKFVGGVASRIDNPNNYISNICNLDCESNYTAAMHVKPLVVDLSTCSSVMLFTDGYYNVDFLGERLGKDKLVSIVLNDLVQYNNFPEKLEEFADENINITKEIDGFTFSVPFDDRSYVYIKKEI